MTLPVFISTYALCVDYSNPFPPHVLLSLVGDNDTLTGLSYLFPASDLYLLIASDAYLGGLGLRWSYFFHSLFRPPKIILSARTLATSRLLSCDSLWTIYTALLFNFYFWDAPTDVWTYGIISADTNGLVLGAGYELAGSEAGLRIDELLDFIKGFCFVFWSKDRLSSSFSRPILCTITVWKKMRSSHSIVLKLTRSFLTKLINSV